MMRQTSRVTVGVPWVRLHAHAPRGVVRVARNVVERLVGRPEVRLLAISEPIFERSEVLFDCQDMAEWLAEHPVRIPIDPPPPPPLPSPLPPRGVRGLWRNVVKPSLRVTARAVGVQEPARRWYRKLRGVPPDPPPALPGPPPPPPRILPVVSAREIDVIVSFECFDPVWAWPMELYDCRMIGFCYDLIPFRVNEGAGWNPGLYLRTMAQMVGRASSVGCISESTRRDLERIFPAAAGRTWLFPLAADAERFLPPTEPPADRHPLALRPGRKVVMIGEVEPRKNQAGVLRACRHLGATHPDERLTLIIVGQHLALQPLQQVMDEAAKYVDVQVTGYVPDTQIGDLLRSCDVFVFPSLWEGFGIPILEAMHAGVPVVCADTSSMPEVAGPHAEYCDPHDPESIAAAIRRQLSLPPADRQRRLDDARRWAAGFSWDRTAEVCLEQVTRAAHSPPTPPASIGRV